MLLRVQTIEGYTAVEALKKGLAGNNLAKQLNLIEAFMAKYLVALLFALIT